LTSDQELLARRRRATVIYAANLVVSDCLDDQQWLEWDEDTGLPVDDGDLGGSFVWRFFPPRFRGTYDAAVFRKVLVTAAKVGYDLARDDGAPRRASPRSSSSTPSSNDQNLWMALGRVT
jgi:hypothetical protein